MISTYSINIHPMFSKKTDDAIGLFLEKNSFSDVEDALDTIFQLGVDAAIELYGKKDQKS